MAKTVTIKTDHEYTSKGKTITVEEALAWCEKHEVREDEEGNETPKYSPGDLICYAVNRLKALSKDQKRYDKGILATRRYAPRVDNVEHKPRKLVTLVEEVHATQETTPRKPKVAKPKTPRRSKAPKVTKPAVAETGNADVAAVL